MLPLPAHGLCLRFWESKDAACVMAAGTDPYIPLVTTIPAQCGELQAQEWIARQHSRVTEGSGISLCIAKNSTNEALGMIGLFEPDSSRSQIRGGYWLDPSRRGQNIAGVALKILSPWALSELSLRSIELLIEPANIASICAAKYAGYTTLQRTLNAHKDIGGTLRDMALYSFPSLKTV